MNPSSLTFRIKDRLMKVSDGLWRKIIFRHSVQRATVRAERATDL